MKKILTSVALCFLMYNHASACADTDTDAIYFNLFGQEIIQQPEYFPFLLAYDTAFYEPASKLKAEDENIKDWEKYFNNQLSYEETNALVKIVALKHLQNWKKGDLSHQLSKKLGKDFYTKYREGIDYLIKAKELEPYMFVKYVPGKDSFYDMHNEGQRNASDLNYAATIKSLQDSYNTAKSADIKLRYAYQLVRFNHYSLKFNEAVKAFTTYVAPLNLKNAIYWDALDQKAGALRGLKKMDDANWDFFQVFIHRKTNKESVYSSLKFTNSDDFKNLLNRAKTQEEKNMAYFLLGYNSYNNPTPIMDKMIANNANSDILKVLAVRAINQLERNYLPVRISCYDDNCDYKTNKLPVYQQNTYYGDSNGKNFIAALDKTLQNAKAKSQDKAFWDIAIAYVKLLQNDHASSMAILNKMSTTNAEYQQQITKMKMLNDILSQKKITPEFENNLLKKYADVFKDKERSGDPFSWRENDTRDFILDILANRYFMEHQDAKSFLLNNKLSDLQYNPNSDLVAKVQAFYKKPDKTNFEKYITKSFDDVGDVDSFFNVIYGDRAMRIGNFQKALTYYQQAKNFKGIPRPDYWVDDKGNYNPRLAVYKTGEYNGFNNISSLVFGHNKWVSYESKPNETMLADDTSAFPFISKNMNKLQLADALVQLKKTGEGSGDKAKAANRLIGNLMYNTSILGYYRHLFVMDVDNSNGQKFHFDNSKGQPFHFYYKNFLDAHYVEPDNFDIAIGYFQKALQQTSNREEKAKILFQMAQAEQGKYYQWEASQSLNVSYSDKDYDAKSKQFDNMLITTKNQKYRTYFAELKKNYSNTSIVNSLESNCLYFDYYMSK
ncbi:hypothetical protein KRE40_14650 [Elizabethkingia meningoseptica]|uniref:hypothetical protein n=1 Tax=Elizabethkingia meningoseptica TaxID=238 RepID=UPI0008A958DB|nr:hypothetical protein [Elizabethkingia meningoseptica]MDE5438356.1 hypothetical protein [Elizabethkingia meningoseptica]MDE5449637.1 hypothetical protein [Elizabethkingia meningoseptica]MDE5472902.1 hypothetical protein [Elizabethkingia meningoseptica]MDE5509883.1 hypothetical protein [Elizabethkingia meningoseptica]MDE5517249.1 hypothetical protein [Elizabethkingia meningoseptica]